MQLYYSTSDLTPMQPKISLARKPSRVITPPSSSTIKTIALVATTLGLLYVLFSSGTPLVETESNFDKVLINQHENSHDSRNSVSKDSSDKERNGFVLSTLEETMRSQNQNPKFNILPTGAEDEATKIKLAVVAGEQFRMCIKFRTQVYETDNKKLFENLETVSNECRQETEARRIKISEVRNLDEVKQHVYSQSTAPSVVLTLGVGADTDAEQIMKTSLPKDSEFFFADPIVDPNAALVEKLGGAFFPVAVGAKTEEKIASLRNSDGSYQDVKMSHVDMETFMKKMVNRTRIDHLLLDNEGPEYEILPLLLKGGVLEKIGVTICQMNVEFHMAQKHDGTWWRAEAFEKVWRLLSEDGRFQPLLVKNVGHLRTYFLNTKDKFCVEKYAAQFF